VGVSAARDTVLKLRTGRKWQYIDERMRGWMNPDFKGGEWETVKKGSIPESFAILGCPDLRVPMWGGSFSKGKFKYLPEIFFRAKFNIKHKTDKARLELVAPGQYAMFINGVMLKKDSLEMAMDWTQCRKREDFAHLLKDGENVIAVHVRNAVPGAYGLLVQLSYMDRIMELRPKLPSMDKPMTHGELAAKNIRFPKLPNFEYDSKFVKKW
jgi:hypothetical protein